MPRDANGNYTLPAGNPVVSGTPITTVWANPTLQDVAQEITNSLSRNGEGGMLVPFQNTDGAIGTPGITWTNETKTGFYRAGTNDMRVSVNAIDKFRWTATSVQLWNDTDLVWEDIATGEYLPLTGGTLTGAAGILELKAQAVDNGAYMEFSASDGTRWGYIGKSLTPDVDPSIRISSDSHNVELFALAGDVNLHATAVNVTAINSTFNGRITISQDETALQISPITAGGSTYAFFADTDGAEFGLIGKTGTIFQLRAGAALPMVVTSPVSIDLTAPETKVTGKLFCSDYACTLSSGVHSFFDQSGSGAGFIKVGGLYVGGSFGLYQPLIGEIASAGDIVAFQGLPNEIRMSDLAANAQISNAGTISIAVNTTVTITFTRPFPDINYAVTATVADQAGGTQLQAIIQTKTATTVQIHNPNSGTRSFNWIAIAY